MPSMYRCLPYLALLLFTCDASAATPVQAEDRWSAAWTASPVALDEDPDDPLFTLDGQTVRQRARLSVGGDRVRIQLSNAFGLAPLTVGSATVATSRDPASVNPHSIASLTFGGRNSVTIPPGAPVLSDPVALAVAPGGEISISLYFPGRVASPTVHSLALKRSVISARGDFTRAEKIEAKATAESSIALTAVLVPARPGRKVVVAFGDSIVDGDGSSAELDRSWPGLLARRLSPSDIAVVNAGIAGNRLLADGFGIKVLGPGALARFDRDVLSVPGATHVVVLAGINDLGFPGAAIGGHPLAQPGETRTAEDLIAAYRQLIARGHAGGLKVIAATLMPFEGVELPVYYSESKEQTRQAVNAWIRGSREFDGVADFDAVVRDSKHPARMQARYASPDHLHPSDVGYQALADSMDPLMFGD